MRQQLAKYVDLLFAGAPDAGDMKQEILQNTLDRYDDLIAQGKAPEAAYSLSISGIGDISEILSSVPQQTYVPPAHDPVRQESDRIHKRILRAVAVALYIICPIPLFVLSEIGMDTIGLCGTLAIIALATVLIILGRKTHNARTSTAQNVTQQQTPGQELRSSINSVIWTVGLCVYFGLSFITQAWHITWIIFLMIGPVQGLLSACLDLKEANDHEK